MPTCKMPKDVQFWLQSSWDVNENKTKCSDPPANQGFSKFGQASASLEGGGSVYLEMCSNGGGLCFTLLTVLFT